LISHRKDPAYVSKWESLTISPSLVVKTEVVQGFQDIQVATAIIKLIIDRGVVP
jgi:hypothetical protein